jgi:hypothetical protein
MTGRHFQIVFFFSLYRRYQSVMKRRVEDRQQHSNIEKLFNQVDESLIKYIYIYNKKKELSIIKTYENVENWFFH